MKKLLLTYLFALVSCNLLAQSTVKLDKIIKKNYDILEVNITKISDSIVEFTYPLESATNSLELSKVAKIIYKSGRIQEFQLEEIKVPTKEILIENNAIIQEPLKPNTIAVLPIPFVNMETLASSSEMAKFAQNDVYNNLLKNSAKIFPLTVQDIRVTNSLLKNAGIDYSNIDEILIEDLHAILGVDHVVASKVSYTITSNVESTGFGNTTIKKGQSKDKIDDFSVSSSTETQDFSFTVYFDIYKDKTKIYTKSRVPLLTEKNAWMDSMQYLLVRSPIYTK